MFIQIVQYVGQRQEKPASWAAADPLGHSAEGQQVDRQRTETSSNRSFRFCLAMQTLPLLRSGPFADHYEWGPLGGASRTSPTIHHSQHGAAGLATHRSAFSEETACLRASRTVAR